MKVQGNTLFYTLMISMIISTMLGGLILINHYQSIFIQKPYSQEVAFENLLFGVQDQLSYGFPKEGIHIEQSDSEGDSLYLQSEDWGLFQLLHGKSIHGRENIQRSALIGQRGVNSELPTLFLTDMKQPLIISGKTRLIGSLVLPGGGIRSGYIGNRYYEYSDLYQGRVSSSKGKKKPIQFLYAAGLLNLLEQVRHTQAGAEVYIMDETTITHPWDSTAFEFRSPYSLELSKVNLRGKVIIISLGEVIIHSDAYLEHTLVIAKSIRVDPGFEGIFQGYASEKIEIGEGVKLNYPSNLGVFRSGKEAGELIIHSNVEIEGGVILDLEGFGMEKNRNDYMLIEQGAQIWGQVYATHNLDLRGAIYGQVITDNFLFKTAGTQYRNYLLDGIINQRELSPSYAGPMIYQGADFQVIEWLERY